MAASIGERGFFPFWGIRARRAAVLVVSFNPNGTGTVTLSNKQIQRGLTAISRTGTGAYTLTLDQKYTSLLNYHATARAPSGGPYIVNIIGTPSLGASGGATVPIQIFSGTSAADISADPNAEVFVQFIFSKTSLESER
jgi:hypothetical protein